MRLPALLADPAPAPGRLWFANARLWDAPGGLRERGSLLVENGRIAAIASAGEQPPADATVLDVDGRTLVPGLVDAHVHLSASFPLSHTDRGTEPILPGTRAHLLARDVQEVLRMGITTVRDVGGYGDLIVEARQAMRYGAFRGPRLLTCGRIVSPTCPGGRFFPGMYREADGEDAMRGAVREQLRYGADFVKVMTTGSRTVELEDPDPAQLTREELRAIVDEAHRQGYRVAAHCEGIAGTELAVEEAVDTIEHGMYLSQRPDLLERMAASGQVLVPTLSFLHAIAGLDGDDGKPSATWSPLLVELAQYNVEQALLTVGAAHAAGVTIAMGFDSSPAGANALELVHLVEAGLTATEALEAGTLGSATALGLGDAIGTLESGMLADLVVVDGDPLTDPAVLRRREAIWLVVQLGTPVAGTALERRLAGVT